MLSMETVQIKPESINNSLKCEEEDGEILEDGEIDDEDVNVKSDEVINEDATEAPQANGNGVEVEEVVENVEEDEEDGASGDDEKKKHHKRSHHRRRRRKHDKEERKSEEKKTRHKKRKGEEMSDDGGESPPSRKKKKRKKHYKDKKERESTSPEGESVKNYAPGKRGSESPPLPSEQSMYNYGTYDSMNAYDNTNDYDNTTYSQSTAYNTSNNSSAVNNYAYNAESYQQEADYTSGSDSYYSDFESHLKQYQSYKQNKDNKNDTNDASDDDDNYYSVGYDAEQQNRKRRHPHTNDNSRPSRRSHHTRPANTYDERRRPSKSRGAPTEGRNSINREDQPICRYFKEGHCSKGDKCIYNHQLPSRRRRDPVTKKIPDLCHHYMNGYCQLGDKCNYMHEEYPCKYFHTGTQCYNGENCRFSHEPANEQTKEIIKQFQDAFNNIDDSKEIEALEKVGIKPLQKPPPGKGLLPTPTVGKTLLSAGKLPPPTKARRGKNSKSIPSLFDINVQPTPELQQKIEANTVASLKMMDDDEGYPGSMPAPMYDPSHTGGGLLPIPGINKGLLRPPAMSNFAPPPSLLGTPPGPPMMITPQNPQAARIVPPILPPGSATPPWIQRQQALLMQQQEEAKDFYDNFYSKPGAGNSSQGENTAGESEKSQNEQQNKEKDVQMLEKDEHDDPEEIHDEEMKEKEEDVIRMDDHDVIKEGEVKAPDFLPAKQKALFMRIHQKRSLSSENKSQGQDQESNKGTSGDNWTYSSDDDDNSSSSSRRMSKNTSVSAPTSVQSIMQMISSKKTDGIANVDTNLLSKVANVISMNQNSGTAHGSRSTYTTNSQSHGKTMMSPPRQPHHRERKSSSSDASPGHSSSRHHPLRRRLSTSELNKEAVTIPLVAKQNVDSIHTTHPDPRMTLSRLFGKTRSEFRGPLPAFGKDVMMPGTGKLVGLKITLSSDTSKEHGSGDKRGDPRLAQSQTRQRPGDPRVKVKPNDPRLRGRASSTTKTSPSRGSPTASIRASIPSKPTALLTKPSSSIIPSLPELNLDLANIQDQKEKSPKQSTSPVTTKSDPLARLPKLLRGSVRPATSPATQPQVTSPKEASPPPTIAPYDPRYITAGASNTTAQPAPYDPRVLSSQTASVPPLYDPRGGNPETKKRTIQLPKLTPAPGYAAKSADTNGTSHDLPSGEQEDF